MELYQLTIHEAWELLRKKEISSVELTESVLRRIEETDDKIRAYLKVTPDLALQQAREADERRAAGDDTPLLGVPMAIKDVITTKGIETTAASKILEGYVPPYDATVTGKIREAGAVILGKTNLDEFAMGWSTENSGYFVTHNPWDLDRVPGGSSGGNAAALAADETIGSLGTDTGGSVRQPASFCNVVGLRPSYGRVSRYGVIAFASSLDQVGPMTKDVRDAAILLNYIAGRDPKDSTSVDVPVPDYTAALDADIKGMKVGLPKEYFVEGMDPGVEKAIREAISTLEELGAEVREVSLPHTKYGVPVYYLVAPAEASANLARYDGIRYGLSIPGEDVWDSYEKTRGAGFGDEVRRRILLGTYALSAGYYDAYYLKAQKVRTLIKKDFEDALDKVDVIVGPTIPMIAFKIGQFSEDPTAMYLTDILSLPNALAGLPAISVPAGFSEGMPVGMQIMAKPFQEEVVLHVAYAFEQATEWRKFKPPLDAKAQEVKQ